MSSKTLGVVAWTFLYYPPQCGGRGMDICIPQRQCGGRGQIHLEENSQFGGHLCQNLINGAPYDHKLLLSPKLIYKVQNFASDEKIVLII